MKKIIKYFKSIIKKDEIFIYEKPNYISITDYGMIVDISKFKDSYQREKGIIKEEDKVKFEIGITVGSFLDLRNMIINDIDGCKELFKDGYNVEFIYCKKSELKKIYIQSNLYL